MNATCGRCGAVQTVDVVEPDFRCESCAVAEVDAAAKRRTRMALTLIAAGGVLSVFVALMWGANWNPGYDSESLTDGGGLIFYLAVGAVGLIGGGLGMLKFRPRLRRD